MPNNKSKRPKPRPKKPQGAKFAGLLSEKERQWLVGLKKDLKNNANVL